MEKPITPQQSTKMMEDSKAKKLQPKAKGKMPAGLAKYLADKKAKAGVSTPPIKK
jgi:hypothetical protein